MNYPHDSWFPSSANLALLQKSMHALPQLLKSYRAQALEMYRLAKSTSLKLKHSIHEIAWESINIQDFYVEPVALSQGAFLCDIRDFVRDYPELSQKYLVHDNVGNYDKSQALVEASFNRGAVLYIPAGINVDTPIYLQHLLGAYRQQVLLEKVVVIVGAGSYVVINDILESESMVVHAALRSVEYHSDDNAHVTINYKQNLSQTTQDISRVAFWCSLGVNLNYNALMIGASNAYLALDCFVQGSNAQATLRGAYVQSQDQFYTITTHQEHSCGQASSEVIFKGIVTDNAFVSYTGDIVVHPGAHKTKAAQDNHTLLLSSAARAYSMPRLQVLTNDVQCAHGSAVGQLDKEHTLYLQSRGISAERARKMLLTAFLTEVINDDETRASVIQRLGENL